MADPAAPDFRDAQYHENVGRLEHQLKTTLAGDEETLRNAKTAYDYNNSLISQQEPGRYAQNRYRAVNEGIAQSGINTGRRGQLAAGFINRRAGLTNRLQETEGRVHRGEGVARERTAEDEARELRLVQERGKAKAEKEPHGTIPGQAGSTEQPAPPQTFPGGVVPYQTSFPGGGFVRVGATRGPSPRQLAAKRAARR